MLGPLTQAVKQATGLVESELKLSTKHRVASSDLEIILKKVYIRWLLWAFRWRLRDKLILKKL